MAILTKEQIKEAKDLGTREVEVLEWGGEVFVKRLTGYEADKWNQANYERAEKRGKGVDFSGSRARYAILVAFNEAGDPLFGKEDEGWLSTKSAAGLGRIWDAGRAWNGDRDVDGGGLEPHELTVSALGGVKATSY